MLGNYNQEPQFITIPVQGEDAANRMPIAMGVNAILIDFNNGKFWFKSNPNGIPQPMRSFEFKETTPQPVQVQNGSNLVTRNEFETLSQNVNSLADDIHKLVAELGGTK